MVSTLHRRFALRRDSLRVAFHPHRKPFLKLPTVDEEPGRPEGPVLVRLPDGREWEFRFVKIACNVAGPRGSNVGDTLPNELPTLLREWFGPDAGLHLKPHHPRPRLRPHRRGRLLGPGERAGGDRLDGGAGRGGEARHVRGAGDGHVDGAADPGRLMVPVPPVSGGLARGPDRARAVRGEKARARTADGSPSRSTTRSYLQIWP